MRFPSKPDDKVSCWRDSDIDEQETLLTRHFQCFQDLELARLVYFLTSFSTVKCFKVVWWEVVAESVS